MSKLTVVAAACVVVALLLRRRRRRQRKERRQKRLNSATSRDNRRTTNGESTSKRSRNGPAYPRPTSVNIKDEAPSSEDEILAHLLSNDNEIHVKEEIDALAIKDEVYDGDDDEQLSENYSDDYVGSTTDRYACDYCDETFTRKAYMRWHIKECHDTTEQPEDGMSEYGDTAEDEHLEDEMSEYDDTPEHKMVDYDGSTKHLEDDLLEYHDDQIATDVKME